MSLLKIVRSLSKPIILAVVFTGLAVSFTRITAGAQESMARRVKSKVAATYPEIARKMNLSGVVKIEVTVAANGIVKDTKVIGGNPILVNAAVDAVKKWRFESASNDSVDVIEFKFDPTVN